ncbi:plastocyanin/azurin family copper-binding protein [Halomicrococcus sp. NG-SE-24]|uniref:plastocyanin/azurin family copper-binding protein n=1 Tax=Halomicrococcus sp. NG-SE-24 TaxID=3436928 RepID=UPI003D97E7C9
MDENSRSGSSQSRRRFLAVAGGSVFGLSAVSAAQETTTTTTAQQEPATSFSFGGRVQAWMGREPQRLADQENPTLQLQAGRVYEVTWENLDGQPHNWALQDDQGNNLSVIFPDVQTGTAGTQTTTTQTTTPEGTPTQTTVETVTPPDDAISVTDTLAEQGATQTLRFVATSDITTYICTIHPTTMVGDVEIQDGGGGGGGN